MNRQSRERVLWLQIDQKLSSMERDLMDIQTVEVVFFIAMEVCPTLGKLLHAITGFLENVDRFYDSRTVYVVGDRRFVDMDSQRWAEGLIIAKWPWFCRCRYRCRCSAKRKDSRDYLASYLSPLTQRYP
jgi:hypothetical protein